MKKFLIILSLFFLLNTFAPLFSFAYSFTEFPIIPKDELFSCNMILWDNSSQQTKWITTDGNLYFDYGTFYNNNPNYKIFVLHDDLWVLDYQLNYDWSDWYPLESSFYDFTIYCTDTDIYDWSFGEIYYQSNSKIPVVDWQQLTYQQVKQNGSFSVQYYNNNQMLIIAILAFIIFVFSFCLIFSIFGLMGRGTK